MGGNSLAAANFGFYAAADAAFGPMQGLFALGRPAVCGSIQTAAGIPLGAEPRCH